MLLEAKDGSMSRYLRRILLNCQGGEEGTPSVNIPERACRKICY